MAVFVQSFREVSVFGSQAQFNHPGIKHLAHVVRKALKPWRVESCEGVTIFAWKTSHDINVLVLPRITNKFPTSDPLVPLKLISAVVENIVFVAISRW